MKNWLALIVAFSFTLSNSAFAQAPCAKADPAALAEAFFKKHPEFYAEHPTKIKPVITARLYAALKREFDCAKGEICAIDAVPWTDAQDGDIGKPVTFSTTTSTDTRATVTMRYPFVLSKTERRQQSVRLDFTRASDAACWLLSDLVSPGGQSLVAQIESWHRQYGKVR